MTGGLHLDQICITLEDQILVAVHETIAPGKILTIMGPSGSGKSTLLSYIGGFLAPVFSASGHVMLNGRSIHNLPAHARRVGVLFQDPLLFPHLSVLQNLLFAIPAKMGDRQLRKAHALDALREVGLHDLAERDPTTLSGGQKARVALMRVLLSQPSALLLDEPFSKLDADLRAQIRRLVFDLARARNLPVLLVTHDVQDADAAGGKTIGPKSVSV